MNIVRICNAIVLSVILGLGVTACEKKEQGPAEKLGAKIDSAGRDVKAAAEDAAEEIEKAAEEAEDELDD